jgi:hypothetical protein
MREGWARRLRFEHLAGPRAGEVDVVESLPATIGSEAGLAIVVPGAAARHAQIFARGQDVVIQDFGAGQRMRLAGHTIREAVLRDGDILEVGTGGARLLFKKESRLKFLRLPRLPRLPLPQLPLPPPGHRAFYVALAVVLAGGAVALGWTYRINRQVALLREALSSAEKNRQLLEGRVENERRKAELDRLSLEARIEDSRKREDALSRRITQAAGGELQMLREELRKTRGRLLMLEGERAVGERIIRDYGAGVCLIQGAYAFYSEAGRALHYNVDKNGDPIHEADGSLGLDVSGNGPLYTVDYYGTGFLIDRKGLVVTNRHVAQPWWKDDTAQSLAKEGYRARFVTFRAFFPGVGEPFKLDLHRISTAVDLALLKADLKGRKLPVLPLDPSGAGAVAGQPVVVVGYPTGLEALMAKADTGVVQEIVAAHGTNSARITEALARKGLIRPSTTQGHIGDVTKSDIVFDAPTTQGGSGGPVFGKSGRVIAVEYAVLSKFGGNSFGLPVRHALALLREPRT